MKVIKFLLELKESHKFFVKETPSFIAGHKPIRWATKSGIGWVEHYWYYPLSFKQKLYYPIAYFKFTRMCI